MTNNIIICNPKTLKCTKKELINFIDKYKKNIINYQGVIVHIISHGSNNDYFMTSDNQEIKLDFIKYEIIKASSGNPSLLKMIFYHACRGNADYHNYPVKVRYHPEISNQAKSNFDGLSAHINFIVVYGNIKGATVSADAYFTNCIIESFMDNAKSKLFNKYLMDLIIDIRANLQEKTENAEICTIDNTLRHKRIKLLRQKKNNHKDANGDDPEAPLIQLSHNHECGNDKQERNKIVIEDIRISA